jgi:hypothetical protein
MNNRAKLLHRGVSNASPLAVAVARASMILPADKFGSDSPWRTCRELMVRIVPRGLKIEAADNSQSPARSDRTIWKVSKPKQRRYRQPLMPFARRRTEQACQEREPARVGASQHGQLRRSPRRPCLPAKRLLPAREFDRRQGRLPTRNCQSFLGLRT